MTIIEQIKADIERKKRLLSTLESEKPVPKDLEEAAVHYASVTDQEAHGIDFIREVFIAGAEWQAEQLLKSSPLPEDTILFNRGVEEGKRQMMEKAVEVEGVAFWQYLDKYGRDFYKVETEDFTTHGEICDGDKVKVIIVKEEKI